MTVDGTQPGDQSSTRLSQAELDRRAHEAATNPLALSPLFNPNSMFAAMNTAFDPRAMANAPPGMQGILTMIGPLLSGLLSMFMPQTNAPGANSPTGPGVTSPTQTQNPFVMAQNYAPRAPGGANV